MFTPRYLLNKSCFFLFFGLFCEPALTFPKTIDKPSMSMVSHKTIHSMAMVGLEKNIGKTIDTNGWNLKNHWKTIDTNGSNVKKPFKNHRLQWFFFSKNHYHSIVVKILPSFRSKSLSCSRTNIKEEQQEKFILTKRGTTLKCAFYCFPVLSFSR